MVGQERSLWTRTGRMVELLALLMALLGGVALGLIVLITLANIVGRALVPFGLTSVRGQVELVQAATVFAVCAFLPWAHLKREHASVEIFTNMLGRRANRIIDLIADLVLLALAVLIAWQHARGMSDKMAYGETTFLLRLPLWWAYGASLTGLGAWIVVGFWASMNSLRQLFMPPVKKLVGRVHKTEPDTK